MRGPRDFKRTDWPRETGAAPWMIKLGAGYDHCWVLRDGEGVRLAARLKDPETGRVMEILTIPYCCTGT